MKTVGEIFNTVFMGRRHKAGDDELFSDQIDIAPAKKRAADPRGVRRS
jgi:hypothetical protein